MKFRWPDGSLRTDGFVVSADGSVRGQDMHIWRDAAGLWCPIGLPERHGPTFCAWDEVIDWELDGERGLSLVEQAIVRHVF